MSQNTRKRKGSHANDMRERPAVKRRRQRTNIDPTLPLYAEMLSNPCNSQLIPGIFGDAEGLLARVKSTITSSSTAGSTCGYLLWSPDYHEKGSNATTNSPIRDYINVLAWTSDDPDVNPQNSQSLGAGARKLGTSTTPFASDPLLGVTSRGYDDPAAELLTSDIVQDARTIGACIKMTYTGTQRKASGQYARVQDLPLSAIFNSVVIDGDEGPSSSISVNEIFRVSTNTGRLGIETLENVSRPDDSSHVFRGGLEGPLTLINDVVNSPNANTKETTEASTLEPQWFGFAWRGLDTSEVTPLVFELFKSIEWRPKPNSGFTLANKQTVHTTSQIKKVTQVLDKAVPTWRDGKAHSRGPAVADLDQMIRDHNGGNIPLSRAEKRTRNARHAMSIVGNGADSAYRHRGAAYQIARFFDPTYGGK